MTKIVERVKKYANTNRISFVMLVIGGIITGFCVVYPSFGFLEWMSLVPAAVVLLVKVEDSTVSLRRLYGIGFMFFMSFFLVVYSWFFSMYPLEFTDFSRVQAAAVVVIAWLGLSLLASLWYGFIPVIAAVICRGRAGKKIKLMSCISFALLWSVFEWGLTLHWTGVPWGRISLGQTEVLLTAQSASLFGSYFVTFVVILINFLLAKALISENLGKICIAASAMLFAANLAAGLVISALTDSSDRYSEKFKIAAVQANVSSQEKWVSGGENLNLNRNLSITEDIKKANPDIKYILWSETSFLYEGDVEDSVVNDISKLAKRLEVNIFVGLQLTVEKDGETLYYNSLGLVKSDGELDTTFYSKRHLVPFGEYLPWRNFFMKCVPLLSEISMLSYDLSPGEDCIIFNTDVANFGSLICFDSIYEDSALLSVRNGAEVLLLATNDSWFDNSQAGAMHLSQARLRAIENSRYLVRAANTGISAIISPTGAVLNTVEPLTETYAIAEVTARQNRTLYSYIGNTFIYLSLAAIFGLIVFNAAYYLKRKSDNWL